ncbi:hypothetical protein J3458_021046 [Metarhizium acridum]|uniref:uncharacterized protein n=1 Tax=Metarhizium acridum TaxID=92637 RepID=UPI001C6C14CF|nr:hypothetical protein J3458_021046 [Metarhizium acridum]
MEVEFVKRYEKAKKFLNSYTELNSNTLDKCHVFIAEVNKETSFHAEVSKLTLEELGFASICFEARGLKVINDSFRASKLRDYMCSQHISCLNRKEIFRRLEHYNRSRDNTFGSVYYTAKEEYEQSKNQKITPAFSSRGMSGTVQQVATYTTA